jgi:hypothetical protein
MATEHVVKELVHLTADGKHKEIQEGAGTKYSHRLTRSNVCPPFMSQLTEFPESPKVVLSAGDLRLAHEPVEDI